MRVTAPVVFFTGAGISVAAGLPTYRGAGGIYEGSDLEPPHARDATEAGIAALWERFSGRLLATRNVQPTRAHRAIAALAVSDQAVDDAVAVITQNVDGLHVLAGSPDVIELHGSLRRVRCLHCHQRGSLPDADEWQDGVPVCTACLGPCRPDIVLFGEQLSAGALTTAASAVSRARTVVAVGTSGSVYPAALLIERQATARAERVWVNPAPPPDADWTWIEADADSGVEALLAGTPGMPRP